MPTYLGLDCGGSSCRALALNESGEPVFLAQGGSANLTSTPEATLERSLAQALEGLPPVDFVCACFAGLQTEETYTFGEEMVRRFIPTGLLKIEPDFAAALRACPAEATACVIAGTGSIVCSRDGDGVLIKSGGCGYLLGDEGSGYQYGKTAIQAYVRNPNSASYVLKETVERLFFTTDPQAIIVATYQAPSPASFIAGAAAALFKDADQQVPYALATIRRETAALADVTAEHLRKHHAQSVEPIIGLAGSVWKKKIVRDAFQLALSERVPSARAVKSEFPPARGAALLAMEMDTTRK